jgi:general secretion pathway protein D
LLGSIPIIGELFRTRSGSKTKRNLMVFIRPTILRDGVQAAVETNAKYNVLRNQQLARKRGEVSLLPGERQPTLPPIEELSRYADPTAGATQARAEYRRITQRAADARRCAGSSSADRSASA